MPISSACKNKPLCLTAARKQTLLLWTQVSGWRDYPALTLWNLVIDVLEPRLILSQEETPCIHERNVMQRKTKSNVELQMEQFACDMIFQSIDCVTPNAPSFHDRAYLFVFTENEAVLSSESIKILTYPSVFRVPISISRT